VSEVTKSTGFKAPEDELAEAIVVTQRDWSTCFVFPVQDLNIKALQKRFQLSFCWLLLLVAKGFIAQVGMEGYNANVAVMNLLAMYGNKVAAPLNVTPHNFLVLFKEAEGLAIIPSPTVNHSMLGLIAKINGTPPLGGRGQEDRSLTTRNAAHVAAAAAANLLTEQLNVAESAVAQATTHLELMRAIAEQAHTIAKEAMRCQATMQESLATTCRAQAAAINTVNVAIANKAVLMAELNANDVNKAVMTKSHLVHGAYVLTKTAAQNYQTAVTTLISLCECMASSNAMEDEGSIRTQGTMMTPCSTLTIFITPTMATVMMTPRPIFPGNYFVCTSLLLHAETALALHELNIHPPNKDTTMNIVKIGGRTTIINALKRLLDDGIIMPLQVFHVHIVNSEQEWCIKKATI
jgi:hypothetical protein